MLKAEGGSDMSQETRSESQSPEKRAEELLGQLDRHCFDYLEKCRRQENSKSKIAKLFGKWFTSFDPSSSDSMHQEFLAGIERIVSELAIVLKQTEQKDIALCHTVARKAVSRLMGQKPAREKTTADWYLTVAEYQCSPLLPYLSREDLKRCRDLLLERVPRRMMFPKQRQLLEQIEEIMKAIE
jgi:hypothetical protein